MSKWQGFNSYHLMNVVENKLHFIGSRIFIINAMSVDEGKKFLLREEPCNEVGSKDIKRNLDYLVL